MIVSASYCDCNENVTQLRGGQTGLALADGHGPSTGIIGLCAGLGLSGRSHESRGAHHDKKVAGND